MNPSSIVQLSINGKVVLVPVTTVDSLAIGVESITASASRRLAFGHPRGVLDSSHGGEFQPYLGRQSSEESSQFHEELASLSSALTEVQETFTQLLENFDSCAPYTSQQARAMNQLWAYYNSHADELEAGAADLESLLSSRHHFALDQNAIHRSSTIPSPLSQRNVSLATYNRPNQHFVKQQARRHRRSHSLS